MVDSTSFASVRADLERTMTAMKLSEDLVSFIKERRDSWLVFGKKNSHLYREQLMKMMSDAGLSAKGKVMVYFFFAVIKNQPRVLKAMDSMPEEVKVYSWFSEVRDFVGLRVTQYVSSAERQKKFPAVNIPGTNPGLDILLWCLMTRDSSRTLANLKDRVTFSQLALNDAMQTLAKEGYRKFWDVTVKGSLNPDAVTMNLPAPRMREDYYSNPASDKYPLLNQDLSILAPSTRESGYTQTELETYLRQFDLGVQG